MCIKDLKGEIWRDIPNYEGFYQVSSEGRVKSLDREVTNKLGVTHKRKGIIRKACKNKEGYYCICLTKGKKKTFKVHQLVAMAFLNHKPCGFKIVVDHIDNNPSNNKLSNLQIISHRENCTKDRSRHLPTGVIFTKGSYVAKIQFEGCNYTLGYFDTPKEASSVYKKYLGLIEKTPSKARNLLKKLQESRERDLPTGIYTFGKKFMAKIQVGGEGKYLGCFDDLESATDVREVCQKILDTCGVSQTLTHIKTIADSRDKAKQRGLPVGVYKRGSRFLASMNIKGKTKYIGIFDTPEEAEQARNTYNKGI